MSKVSATAGKAKPVPPAMFEAVKPGDFYIGVFPGHFTCPITGIIFRGPKVRMGGSTGLEILAVDSMPDPVQIPHFKHIIEVDSRGVRHERDVDFDRSGDDAIHEAIQLAIVTGQIKHVPEDVMMKHFPAAYEKRQEKIVYSRVRRDVSMEDLTAAFFAESATKVKPPRP